VEREERRAIFARAGAHDDGGYEVGGMGCLVVDMSCKSVPG
jgi:hypothetical protein